MDKKELLKELEKKFNETKKEFGFKTSLDEIDSCFYLKDSVLSAGVVSDNFFRQLCSVIADIYRGWHGYLNGLLIPNASYMANQTESKLFNTEADKKQIWTLIKKAMYFSSKQSLIVLTKDKKMTAEFIDEAVSYWNTKFSPALIEFMTRINEGWKKE